MENKKMLYLDILRVLATIAVITYHVGSGGGFASDKIIRSLYSNLNVWCVPMFFMITGALMLDPEKDLSLKTHGKRIGRLLAALLFWGFAYNAITTVIIERDFSVAALLYAAKMTLMADTTYAYQLWYLYYVIGIYLILPVIAGFLKNAKQAEVNVLFALCTLFGIVVPTVRAISDLSLLPWGGFGYFSGYLVYVLLGYLLSRKMFDRKANKWIYAVATVLFILVTVLTVLRIDIAEKLGQYETMFAMVLSAALFLLVKNSAHRIENRKALKAIIGVISRHSFAIYLLHVMVIQMYRKLLHIDSTILPLVVSIPLITLLAFGTSLLLSVVLKKVKPMRRLL